MKIETLIELIYCNNDPSVTFRGKKLAAKYLRERMNAERISYVYELNTPLNEPYFIHYHGFGDVTYTAILFTLFKLNNNNIETGFITRRF